MSGTARFRLITALFALSLAVIIYWAIDFRIPILVSRQRRIFSREAILPQSRPNLGQLKARQQNEGDLACPYGKCPWEFSPRRDRNQERVEFPKATPRLKS